MSLAKTYGKALYEAAVEAKSSPAELDEIGKQIDEFLLLANNSKELAAALFGPVVTGKEKAELVQKITEKAGTSPVLSRFLVLLAKKRRFGALSEIREAFSEIRLNQEGGVAGELVSAEPLSEQDLEDLVKAFSKKLGKRVSFKSSTDVSLLAGVRVTVGGVTYDGSLRVQLEKLRDGLVA